MLNSKQIEIFHTVYQEKSITGAARLSNVSQPSISKTLSLSEDKLGYLLFNRFQKRLLPTCLLYTSPSPRDAHESRMPSSA